MNQRYHQLLKIIPTGHRLQLLLSASIFLLFLVAVFHEAAFGTLPSNAQSFSYAAVFALLLALSHWNSSQRLVEEKSKSLEDMERAQARFQAALDAAPVPVCILEGDQQSRRFTYVNAECLRVLGYTKEEMLDQNATDMMFLNDADRAFYLSKVIESIKQGIPLRVEMPLYRKNKVVGHFEFNSHYEMVNGRLHGVLFVHDIEERIQHEQAILEAKDLAEQQARELMEQRDRQAQMYAVIGHELRTPATVLHMLLQEAKQGSGSLDLHLFSTTVDQLLNVIDGLRSVAQPGRMQETAKEPVLLADLINSQLNIFVPLANRHQVQLQSDLSGLKNDLVDVQAQLLRQLISNLVKNAIIHSGGSMVNVKATARVNGGTKDVVIRIEDNGQGISEDQLERLFNAYERGSSDAEGTGLGLFISREMARTMDGDLTYQPAPQGGSCFVLSFNAALSSNIEAPAATPNMLQGKRVLVVEDNATIQLMTQLMLEKLGAIITIANNGHDALIEYESAEFDVILSDIFMPVMDGYKFVSALRSKGCTLPIIGLTAATIGDERDQMKAAGADIVLPKPVDIDDLMRFLMEFWGY